MEGLSQANASTRAPCAGQLLNRCPTLGDDAAHQRLPRRGQAAALGPMLRLGARCVCIASAYDERVSFERLQRSRGAQAWADEGGGQEKGGLRVGGAESVFRKRWEEVMGELPQVHESSIAGWSYRILTAADSGHMRLGRPIVPAHPRRKLQAPESKKARSVWLPTAAPGISQPPSLPLAGAYHTPPGGRATRSRHLEYSGGFTVRVQ